MVRIALLFVLTTAALGLVLRTHLSTGMLVSWGLVFENVRHAHSHAGFYGVLTLAWWLTASRADHALMGTRAMHAHAAASATATALFAAMGYRAPTIVLSTVVAGFWLLAAWRTFRARSPSRDWCDAQPLGVVMGVVLVPAIAMTARSNPALSRELAHVFIGTVLFNVFVPAAWHALAMPRRIPVPIYVVTMTAFSAATVFQERVPIPAALACVLASVVVTEAIHHGKPPRALRAIWYAVTIGLALGPLLPPSPLVRIAGVHAFILGPVLASFAHALAPGRVPRPLAVAYFGLLGAMITVISAPAFGQVLASPLLSAAVSWLFGACLIVVVTRVWPRPAQTLRAPPKGP